MFRMYDTDKNGYLDQVRYDVMTMMVVFDDGGENDDTNTNIDGKYKYIFRVKANPCLPFSGWYSCHPALSSLYNTLDILLPSFPLHANAQHDDDDGDDNDDDKNDNNDNNDNDDKDDNDDNYENYDWQW